MRTNNWNTDSFSNILMKNRVPLLQTSHTEGMPSDAALPSTTWNSRARCCGLTSQEKMWPWESLIRLGFESLSLQSSGQESENSGLIHKLSPQVDWISTDGELAKQRATWATGIGRYDDTPSGAILGALNNRSRPKMMKTLRRVDGIFFLRKLWSAQSYLQMLDLFTLFSAVCIATSPISMLSERSLISARFLQELWAI
jgi:hypothetical protein